MTLKELFKPKRYFMCIARDTNGTEYWINRPSGKVFNEVKNCEVIDYTVDIDRNLYCLIRSEEND